MIPMQCAWCGRLRGEDGQYFGSPQPKDMSRSHGICPPCREHLLRGLGTHAIAAATGAVLATALVLAVVVSRPAQPVTVVLTGHSTTPSVTSSLLAGGTESYPKPTAIVSGRGNGNDKTIEDYIPVYQD
jgi:hypothetical protein